MKALVDLFEEYAGQSVAALGLEEKKFSIGGFGVRLRFAGQRWSGILTKALDHLQTNPPAEPSRRQLTISILDGSLPQRNPLLRTYLQALPERWWEFTGPRGAVPWLVVTGPRGELLNLHGGAVLAFYHPGPDMLTIVDVEADLGFLWKR